MALKVLPDDYIQIDDNWLEKFLENKYSEENGNASSMDDSYELMNDLYDYPESQVQNGLIIYFSPFLLFFSTIGNILSLIILCRLCYEVWSTCVYLAIMSVLDLFIVYTWCGNNWLENIAYLDISGELLISSVSVCKVYMFLFSSVFHMQKWLMVCMAIEGFIARKFPHQISTMCTLSRAKAIILLLTVILACLNIHFFWTFEIVNFSEYGGYDNSEQFACMFVKKGITYSEVFESLIWPVIDILLAQILPLLLVTTFTFLTIVQMFKGTDTGDYRKPSWRQKYLLYPNAMSQLKMSVLIICIFYILTVPKLLMTIYKKVMDIYGYQLELRDSARLHLIDEIFKNLEYLFLSLKFYVLFITCRQFREEFYKICSRLCRCSRGSKGDDIKSRKKGRYKMSDESSSLSDVGVTTTAVASGLDTEQDVVNEIPHGDTNHNNNNNQGSSWRACYTTLLRKITGYKGTDRDITSSTGNRLLDHTDYSHSNRGLSSLSQETIHHVNASNHYDTIGNIRREQQIGNIRREQQRSHYDNVNHFHAKIQQNHYDFNTHTNTPMSHHDNHHTNTLMSRHGNHHTNTAGQHGNHHTNTAGQNGNHHTNTVVSHHDNQQINSLYLPHDYHPNRMFSSPSTTPIVPTIHRSLTTMGMTNLGSSYSYPSSLELDSDYEAGGPDRGGVGGGRGRKPPHSLSCTYICPLHNRLLQTETEHTIV